MTLTRLVLTNAIYFNAAWLHPFDKDATSNADFYLPDGSKVSVPMMRQTESYGYAAGNGYQAVELPYDGNELSMVIIMPDDLKSFEASLTGEQVAGIIQSLQIPAGRPGDAQMGVRLHPRAEGRPHQLWAWARPSPIVPTSPAWTASATFISRTCCTRPSSRWTKPAPRPPRPRRSLWALPPCRPSRSSLTIDHPFIYLIRDIQTGAVLFVGRVVNPS